MKRLLIFITPLIFCLLDTLVANEQDRELSKIIDSIYVKAIEEKGNVSSPKTDDTTFLRRIYLDIIGRIPSYDEADSFLKNSSPNKRSLLVDELLASDEYTSHFYNKWADILRIRTTGQIRFGGGNYRFAEWLKDSLDNNMPYNQMVWEMLTAVGHPWENPATGYMFRDFGMPLDNMANTMQIFLGTQIACAQCHNHPFDKWTQKNFYELTAFTFGTKTEAQINQNEVIKSLQKYLNAQDVSQELKQVSRQIMRQTFDPLRYKVYETNNPIRLPSDYAYKDAKPDSIVQANVPFGKMPEITGNKTHAIAFAEWMTSPDNPRFALVVSNRIFSWLMGQGLIEPVDNIPPENYKSSLPELTTFLEKIFPLINYDLKRYIRILANTELYQMQTHPKQKAEKGHNFQIGKRGIRRMSAEQAWDSLLTIIDPNINEAPVKPNGNELRTNAMIKIMETQPVEKVIEPLVSFIQNNKETDQLIFKNAQREIRNAYGQLMEESGVSIQNETKNYYKITKGTKIQNLNRAIHVQSPPPAGHFLETFGQSDRDIIENSTTDASVPQALKLLNSTLVNKNIMKKSHLADHLNETSDNESRLKVIFYTLLSREPSVDEQEYFLPQMNNESFSEDLIAGIINSQSFLFIE